jgi:hypothetical protein
LHYLNLHNIGAETRKDTSQSDIATDILYATSINIAASQEDEAWYRGVAIVILSMR